MIRPGVATGFRDGAEAVAKAGFFILLSEAPVALLPVVSPTVASVALSVWIALIAWIALRWRTDEEFFVGLRASARRVPAGTLLLGAALVIVYCVASVIAQVLYVSAVGNPPTSEIEATLYQPGGWVPFLLAAVVLAPVVEEAALRGFLQGQLQARYGARIAIVTAAVIFALLHLDPIAMPLLLFDGLVFGVLAWRTGTFWVPAAAHAAANLAILLLGLHYGAASSAADFPRQTGISLTQFAWLFAFLMAVFIWLVSRRELRPARQIA